MRKILAILIIPVAIIDALIISLDKDTTLKKELKTNYRVWKEMFWK